MVYPHRGFAQPSWLEGGYDKKNKEKNKQQCFIRPDGVTPGGLTRKGRNDDALQPRPPGGGGAICTSSSTVIPRAIGS